MGHFFRNLAEISKLGSEKREDGGPFVSELLESYSSPHLKLTFGEGVDSSQTYDQEFAKAGQGWNADGGKASGGDDWSKNNVDELLTPYGGFEAGVNLVFPPHQASTTITSSKIPKMSQHSATINSDAILTASNFEPSFDHVALFTDTTRPPKTMDQIFPRHSHAAYDYAPILTPAMGPESQMASSTSTNTNEICTSVQGFEDCSFSLNDMLANDALFSSATWDGKYQNKLASFAAAPHSSSFETMQPQHTPQPGTIEPTQNINQNLGNVPKSRNFICGIAGCQSAYHRRAELHRHQKTHLGSRQFSCRFTGCDRVGQHGFWRKDHLKQHLVQKHGVSS